MAGIGPDDGDYYDDYQRERGAVAQACDEIDELRAEVESLRGWKAQMLAVQEAADKRLRPLIEGVPGALGRHVYEVAAEEIERLGALADLLAEVAHLGDVDHDPDGDCRGNWDDEPCDPDCHVAAHNALMERVRVAMGAG